MTQTQWLRLNAARAITGHSNTASLARWIARWNHNNPDSLIIRRHGYVDSVTLSAALHREAVTYTPGMAERAAAVQSIIYRNKKRRTRANASAADKRSQP